jgi:hypothetical protein
MKKDTGTSSGGGGSGSGSSSTTTTSSSTDSKMTHIPHPQVATPIPKGSKGPIELPNVHPNPKCKPNEELKGDFCLDYP